MTSGKSVVSMDTHVSATNITNSYTQYDWNLIESGIKHIIPNQTRLTTFLAHLAKGNVSFCHHLASGVR